MLPGARHRNLFIGWSSSFGYISYAHHIANIKSGSPIAMYSGHVTGFVIMRSMALGIVQNKCEKVVITLRTRYNVKAA